MLELIPMSWEGEPLNLRLKEKEIKYLGRNNELKNKNNEKFFPDEFEFLSRKHAKLVLKNGEYYIENIHKSGTFIKLAKK